MEGHVLRNFLLSLVCCLHLTGCALYRDIHGQSHPLDAAKLSKHSVYTPKGAPANLGVWTRFHDPLLNQLICVALEDSPSIASAQARVREADYVAQGVASPLWPTLDFNGYLQRQRFSQTGLVPPPFNGNTTNIAAMALNFNYEFDFWGKNREALKAALGEKFAAEGEAHQARLILSATVANTYFQLLGVIEQRKIAADNQRISERLLHIARDRAQHGVNSAIPVNAIEATLQAATVDCEQLRQSEMLLRHQLAVFLGKNPSTTVIRTPSKAFHFHPIRFAKKMPLNLIAKRPDITAAKYRAEALVHQINVAKSRFYPNINLSMLFSYQNVGLTQVFKSQNQNNAFTGAIDLPLFDAGLRRANLGKNYAEYDIAVNDYNQAILTAIREVSDQLTLLKSLDAQLNAQDQSVQASTQQYKLYRSRYHHGISDTAELLQNQQLLLKQQVIQLNLQTLHLQAVVGMLTALGGNDTIEMRPI
jgi:NodT family efflux transporter outer membrane factor (OMF) lipoprotein